MAAVSGMSLKERELLQINTENIHSNLTASNAETVCSKLYSRKILTQYLYQQFGYKKTAYDKIDYLLTALPGCGSRAFIEFCNAVKDVSPHLSQNLLEQLDDSQRDSEPNLRLFSTNNRSSNQVAEPGGGEVLDSIYPPLNITSKPITEEIAVATDNLIYDMNKSPHGYALIFNNEIFSPKLRLSSRAGTSQDAAMLYHLFTELKYTVARFDNCTKQEIEEKICEYSKKNHENFDSFVCAFLSHGERDFIYGQDDKVNLEDLFANFQGHKCRSLAGKPKIFLIQACRGENFDDGVEVVDSRVALSAMESPKRDAMPNTIGTTLPSEGDFLLAYATVAGNFAWRSRSGSWFIQAVVEVIQKYQGHMDLLRMLTRVNCLVAERESRHYDESMKGKKQIPSVVSMLRKDVYFSIEAARRSGASL